MPTMSVHGNVWPCMIWTADTRSRQLYSLSLKLLFLAMIPSRNQNVNSLSIILSSNTDKTDKRDKAETRWIICPR